MISIRILLFFCFCIEVFTNKLKINYDLRTSEVLILGQCKEDYQTIIITDDSRQLDSLWLQQLHERFHTVIQYKEYLEYHQYIFKEKKIDAILIIIPSFETMEDTLDNLYETGWWNVMTPVYVLHLPDNDCGIAMNTLQVIWENKILTSYFLCMENNEVQIYTYNPFTNRAPSSWTEVQRSPEESSWTLYQRKYHSGTVCQGLDFDRMKHLDGYPIFAIAPIAERTNHSFSGQYIDDTEVCRHGTITEPRYHFIMDVLAITLNVSPSLYLTKRIYYDKRTKTTYLAQALKTAKEDSLNLVLTDYYLSGEMDSNNGEFTRTYPLGWYEKRIATYNRGYRTLVEKLWDFYGIWTILHTIFLLFITFMVILCFENKGIAFAVFEVIRLLICHSLYTKMNTLPLRIFFLSIFIYFLIIQATFSGHLAKFLTKPELRRHAETYEDLAELGYTKIHDAKYIEEHLSHTVERKSNYQDLVRSCVAQIVFYDSTVACIFNHRDLFKYSKYKVASNLYVSKQSSGTLYQTFVIEKHWPLLHRVNAAIMLVEEMGFRQLRSAGVTYNVTHTSFVAEARAKKDFQPIKLENLMFAFSILAIGLISATLSFCLEILIGCKSKWNLISHEK